MRTTTEPLAKRLSLLDVYAVGAGASLSVGFFLLPGSGEGWRPSARDRCETRPVAV